MKLKKKCPKNTKKNVDMNPSFLRVLAENSNGCNIDTLFEGSWHFVRRAFKLQEPTKNNCRDLHQSSHLIATLHDAFKSW